MAPEQLTLGGAPGPLTDLWSLGACAFAAMTARIPFEGEVLGDIVLKVCASPLPVPSQLNPDVPSGFDTWFARACSRDPQKRFQSATELAESLANVCGTGRVKTASPRREPRAVRAQEERDPLESIPIPNPRHVAEDGDARGARARRDDDGRRGGRARRTASGFRRTRPWPRRGRATRAGRRQLAEISSAVRSTVRRRPCRRGSFAKRTRGCAAPA